MENDHWLVIHDDLDEIVKQIESDDTSESEKLQLALKVSYVCFCANELDQAVKYIIMGFPIFDPKKDDDFTKTMCSALIMKYIEIRQARSMRRAQFIGIQIEQGESVESARDMAKSMDFGEDDKDEKEIEDKIAPLFIEEFKIAREYLSLATWAGMAIEARHLDLICQDEEAGQIASWLSDTDVATSIPDPDFRAQLLSFIAHYYRDEATAIAKRSALSAVPSLISTKDTRAIVAFLSEIVQDGSRSVAIQASIDIFPCLSPIETDRILDGLEQLKMECSEKMYGTSSDDKDKKGDDDDKKKAEEEEEEEEDDIYGDSPKKEEKKVDEGKDEEKEHNVISALKEAEVSSPAPLGSSARSLSASQQTSLLSTLARVISGHAVSVLESSQFEKCGLYDPNILSRCKKASKDIPFLQSCTYTSHGFHTLGSGDLSAYRSSAFKNSVDANPFWAAFNMISSIGVTLHGRCVNVFEELSDWLITPRTDILSLAPTEIHPKGGALLALGLALAPFPCSLDHFKIRRRVNDMLLQVLSLPNCPPALLFGGCLSFSLCNLGSADIDTIQSVLMNIPHMGNVMASEAAYLAIGILQYGSTEGGVSMLEFGRGEEQERARRGAYAGEALRCAGARERAGPVYESLLGSQDGVARECGCLVLSMAYVGTADLTIVQRLLHIAVTDTEGDVRRTATAGVGLVMCCVPAEVPRTLNLLSKSFNSHTRVGVCMGVGLACAGSGNAEALALLQPLLYDKEPYVRQYALIAVALVLQQFGCWGSDAQVKEEILESYKERQGIALELMYGGISVKKRAKVKAKLEKKRKKEERKKRKKEMNKNNEKNGDETEDASITDEAAWLTSLPIPHAAYKFRKLLHSIVHTSYEHEMTRGGAIWALGLHRACGGSGRFSMTVPHHPTTVRACSVVASMFFLMSWSWHGYLQMLSLGFVPSSVMCVDDRLNVVPGEIINIEKTKRQPFHSDLRVKRRFRGKIKANVKLSLDKKRKESSQESDIGLSVMKKAEKEEEEVIGGASEKDEEEKEEEEKEETQKEDEESKNDPTSPLFVVPDEIINIEKTKRQPFHSDLRVKRRFRGKIKANVKLSLDKKRKESSQESDIGLSVMKKAEKEEEEVIGGASEKDEEEKEEEEKEETQKEDEESKNDPTSPLFVVPDDLKEHIPIPELKNPCRVVTAEEPFIKFSNLSWKPLEERTTGIVIVEHIKKF
ncbi:26S Proteasome non-ATPase regulatory subunit 1 like protein [Aduncisulcus paluster]|uniref:26S Proteasome non-ATPase regulatory subunit 1 like protein n=1 Tax=Aduncisulcus paluster TaxID=2918883 RepID=A0ABQ5K6D2_9EUKA|nr:26S Proteasome non-ATPase regulatory subunit 1 like protein [Aduncisulcus paluster]